MNNTKTISNVNTQVIKYLKKEIADKKERHNKMIQAIKPKTIADLKLMKKIGV